MAATYAGGVASGGKTTVLLPSYLSTTMIRPFSEIGFQVEFYPVAADLSIDPAELLARCNSGTAAILVMHYFGFHQRHDLIELVHDQFPDLPVIDDRTHMLLSDLRAQNRESSRALTVYSVRKWGPFPDLGAVLWPAEVGAADRLPPPRRYDWHLALYRVFGSFLRTLFFALPAEGLRALSLRPFHAAEARLDLRLDLCRASPFSLLLWRFWDWNAAWHARRANFQYLLENWSCRSIEPLYRRLPDSVCPLGFPVRAEGRDRVRQHLIDEGIFPPVHWVLPTAVPAAKFQEAAELAEHELTIPIDQRYVKKDMDRVLNALAGW